MMDARKRLLAVLSDVAPDLAVALWNDRDVRELPRNIREAICDALGLEAARRGLDANEQPNAYGRELDELAAALGLASSSANAPCHGAIAAPGVGPAGSCLGGDGGRPSCRGGGETRSR